MIGCMCHSMVVVFIVFFFLLCFLVFFFFFFQAEDGIRDRDVTGVQTCALRSSPLITFNVGVTFHAVKAT